MNEMITVEKEVYEAVLRNSVRVNDLEAENQQLKELLRKCRSDLISCFAVGYEDSEFIKKIDEVLK